MDTHIAAGDLQATVTSSGTYGWCGLKQLTHAQHAKPWLLSPAFTLEHYIGVPLNAPDYIEYEPCASPKYLENIAPDGCTLHYDPMKCSQIECAITYHLVAPHYIDVTLRAQTQRADWPLGHMALFFATIVRAPVYTGINLLGKDLGVEVQSKSVNHWIHFNGFAAQIGNVAHPADVLNPELPRPAQAPKTYYYNDSSMRFEQPLFYACVDEMIFALMFHQEDRERVRFVVNPLAPAFGGPAWDFIWVIDHPVAGRAYELSFRSVFKPFVSKQDVLDEYERFERP